MLSYLERFTQNKKRFLKKKFYKTCLKIPAVGTFQKKKKRSDFHFSQVFLNNISEN